MPHRAQCFEHEPHRSFAADEALFGNLAVFGPVIETPLSGAQALLVMLIQSRGGTIRVFPAMPSTWRDAVLDKLSAEGTFLVSAERKGGSTRWIEVASRAGAPFAREPDLADPVAFVAGKPEALVRNVRGHFTCPRARGERLLVYRRGSAPIVDIAPLPPPGRTA